MTYHQKEQIIYDYLTSDIEETKLYFSLRKNGSKGARRDIFIGTEKSNYFKFSLWDIPIGFPGSAGNFIDYAIYKKSNNFWTFKLELAIPKTITGSQNKLSLAFAKELIPKIKNKFPEYSFTQAQEKHKILTFSINSKDEYVVFDKLAVDLKRFIEISVPKVDEFISNFLSNHPEWEAERIDVEKWKEYNSSYQRRLEKYPLEALIQDEIQPLNIEEPILESNLPDFPLNQILFGPPGTGKTYYTINLALQILGHSKKESREEQIELYESERKRGNIVFTTFHQSMSYEDFVEGIKPTLDDDTSDIGYEIKDGILKAVSKLAIQEYVKYNDDQSLTFDERYNILLDKVNESEEGFKINLRTGTTIILEEVSARGNLTVSHINGSRKYTVSKQRLEKVFHAIGLDNDVSNINVAIRNIIGGSNASAYWSVNEFLHNLTGVKQSTVINPDISDTQYQNIIQTVKWKDAEDLNVDRYVIIIDEINRGNVSGILGELITLLEKDKRIDQKNRLVLKLPYSKIDFVLPSNLYIIGTMNTADRSVEALDTALRRRFSFREIMPNPKVIQGQDEDEGSDDIDGLNLVDILNTINSRIKLLIDRDHQIGHSYFLGINNLDDLRNTFKNKIIPLLQEYFYNDYSKIMLVLGSGFVRKQSLNTSVNYFAVSINEVDFDLPDFTYELQTIDEHFDIHTAVQLLFDPMYTKSEV